MRTQKSDQTGLGAPAAGACAGVQRSWVVSARAFPGLLPEVSDLTALFGFGFSPTFNLT